MTQPTIVFDLDGTLVDTAPDLISALNFVLDREGLPPVPLHSARNMIGAGARKLIERGLEVEGRTVTVGALDRMTRELLTVEGPESENPAAAFYKAVPKRGRGQHTGERRRVLEQVVAGQDQEAFELPDGESVGVPGQLGNPAVARLDRMRVEAGQRALDVGGGPLRNRS